jgi:hypothetical protein
LHDGLEIVATDTSEDRLGPYETRSSWERRLGDAETFVKLYAGLHASVAGIEGLSHSAHILEYVALRPDAPLLSAGGCLYLPHNSAWKEFYELVAHPYPPLFAELVAASFYPGCQNVSLQGARVRYCDGLRTSFQGSGRCIGTRRVANSSGISVLVSDGMVGIAAKWRMHVSQVRQRQLVPESQREGMYKERCGPSVQLRQVPTKQRLVIPARYVVCSSDGKHPNIDEAMIRDQNEWTNKGYAGKAPWNQQAFEKLADRPPKVDMQISFELKSVRFVKDERCARDSFYDYSVVEKYLNRSADEVTIVLVGDDMSGILGMSPLPMDDLDWSSPVVLVSQEGLRNYAAKTGGEMAYNEGDTVTHEAGHYLGLYHTFQDGCDGDGDFVDDTEPEELPRYTCSNESSCHSHDPIHNFMDYTPDECMTTFTEQQKRRAWCVLEKYRPNLFKSSLRVEA